MQCESFSLLLLKVRWRERNDIVCHDATCIDAADSLVTDEDGSLRRRDAGQHERNPLKYS